MKLLLLLLLVMAMTFENPSNANGQQGSQDPEDNESSTGESANTWLNLPTKTMGGKQFWSDRIHLHGYRIQKNVMTGHHRLLDERNIRRAWGSLEGCQKKLRSIAERDSLEPMRGRVLIIMHGLTRTRSAMKSIGQYVQNNSDLQVVNVSYASTRQNIFNHAEALKSVIDHMPEVEEVNFLGHSMGSVVVRYYLGNHERPDHIRFGRMVMLAPPNNGSSLARRLQNNLLFKTFWGVSGQDLSRRWEEVQPSLATPDFPFGIIAGGQAKENDLSNPMIKGKDDFVVTVEETRLGGATDFMQRPLLHSTMMNNDEVHQSALRFLENGYFISENERQPIPDKESDSQTTSNQLDQR